MAQDDWGATWEVSTAMRAGMWAFAVEFERYTLNVDCNTQRMAKKM